MAAVSSCLVTLSALASGSLANLLWLRSCRARGLSTYADLIGTALPRKPGAPSSKGVEYRP